MRLTKRPQNKCGYCKYTWHPRGKNISNRCPNCGSNDVRKVTPWVRISIVAFLIYIFTGKEPPKNTPAAPEYHAPNITYSTKSTTPENKAPPPPISWKDQLILSSPTAICETQNKTSSMKDCLERECKKAEFSKSLECGNAGALFRKAP